MKITYESHWDDRADARYSVLDIGVFNATVTKTHLGHLGHRWSVAAFGYRTESGYCETEREGKLEAEAQILAFMNESNAKAGEVL